MKILKKKLGLMRCMDSLAAKAIAESYSKSLVVCYLTPLYYTGLITSQQMDDPYLKALKLVTFPLMNYQSHLLEKRLPGLSPSQIADRHFADRESLYSHIDQRNRLIDRDTQRKSAEPCRDCNSWLFKQPLRLWTAV